MASFLRSSSGSLADNSPMKRSGTRCAGCPRFGSVEQVIAFSLSSPVLDHANSAPSTPTPGVQPESRMVITDKQVAARRNVTRSGFDRCECPAASSKLG